jgi:hypothetical protein
MQQDAFPRLCAAHRGVSAACTKRRRHFTSHDAAQRHAESRAKTPEAESATSILIAPLPFFNVINDFSLCRFYINVKEKAGKTGWHVEKEKLGYFA